MIFSVWRNLSFSRNETQRLCKAVQPGPGGSSLREKAAHESRRLRWLWPPMAFHGSCQLQTKLQPTTNMNQRKTAKQRQKMLQQYLSQTTNKVKQEKRRILGFSSHTKLSASVTTKTRTKPLVHVQLEAEVGCLGSAMGLLLVRSLSSVRNLCAITLATIFLLYLQVFCSLHTSKSRAFHRTLAER